MAVDSSSKTPQKTGILFGSLMVLYTKPFYRIDMNITDMTKEQREEMRTKSKADTNKRILKFCDSNPKFAAYVRSAPVGMRKRYVEALEGTCGKAQALKMKCLECSCWQVEEVKNCAVLSCPLWKVRPYK